MCMCAHAAACDALSGLTFKSNLSLRVDPDARSGFCLCACMLAFKILDVHLQHCFTSQLTLLCDSFM